MILSVAWMSCRFDAVVQTFEAPQFSLAELILANQKLSRSKIWKPKSTQTFPQIDKFEHRSAARLTMMILLNERYGNGAKNRCKVFGTRSIIRPCDFHDDGCVCEQGIAKRASKYIIRQNDRPSVRPTVY